MEIDNCNDTAQPNVLLFPCLAYSHISAYAELSRRLADNGVNVFFLSTPLNILKIKKDAMVTREIPDSPGKGKGKIQLPQLPFPPVEGLPPGIENVADLPVHLKPLFRKAFDGLEIPFQQLLQEIRPDCVVLDFVQWWAGHAAAKLGIPSIYFATFGAAFTSYSVHAVSKEYGDDVTAEDLTRPPPGYPSPAVSLKLYKAQRMLVASHRALGTDTLSFKDRNRRTFDVCSAIAVKACDEIEGSFIRYLREITGKPILPVNPLLPDLLPEREGISVFMSWLEKRVPGSVVYVSFGSQCFPSAEETKEMAAGLEASGCPFLWALNVKLLENPNFPVKDLLPAGFEERIGNRGFVVGEWVLQREILSHPSTGGYLTHCGWNSVMEAMCVGMRLIASPMQFDQSHNARLVVEDLKAGVEIGRGDDGCFRREEVCKAIKIVMGKEEEGNDLGRSVRSKAREIGDVFQQKVLKSGGSQDCYVQNLIEYLCLLKAGPKIEGNRRVTYGRVE